MHHTVSIIPHLNAAAFQTISEEKWKARRRVIYRVFLASDPALALTASNDILHLPSKEAVMLLRRRKRVSFWGHKWVRSEFLQIFRRCWVGAAPAIWSQNVILKCFHICVSMQVQPSHFMLSKWPVTVTHSYCFINRAQTTPVLLEMQRTISSLE